MTSYMIRTNLSVSVLAAIITVALQVMVFETTYVAPSQPFAQLPGATVEEKQQYLRENTVAVTGLENAKGYLSSSGATFSLLNRKALPVFFAVLISLFVVSSWHGRRNTKQGEHV